MFALNSGVILHNKRQHNRTVRKLADNMLELNMLQQIDSELNETIDLSRVFNMMLDWALRFSNAHGASVALYDDIVGTLRTQLNYGYQIPDDELETLRQQSETTITMRVARSGKAEMVSDIRAYRHHSWIPEGMQSQMAVPIIREDRVVAVITLESFKLDAFTDDHIAFVMKLAHRAAVAIDNARLHAETVREREKLSSILGSIADVVIVVGLDNRIMMISQSAISALRLYADVDYENQLFAEAIDEPDLLELYKQARIRSESYEDDLSLPNGREYYTRVMYQPGVGYIVIMQDITPFVEMDRLKTELLATVSHDLKQPLGVMRGYLDLLEMKNQFDQTSTKFVRMIDTAINNMRQLIDDLLDLARIETGTEFKEFVPVPIQRLLVDCLAQNLGSAEIKHMELRTDFPDQQILVMGDRNRLEQIFNNLVSNAIKYTPPDGQIVIRVEDREDQVRVLVQDNGMGISPEEQPHIFDRFYRVRRPETDGIEGTGLGLAIVKKLVEAHDGRIGVQSRLGDGSIFYVTLPVHQQGLR